eukprot:4818612-Prorocentrum_lima.AAC.1
MTSSLVGSEMCIRDRTTCWENALVDPNLRAPRPPEGQHGRRKTGEQRSACLLYTSDAADDM